MLKICSILLFSAISFNAFSWSMIGHRVVGEVASAHLTPKAKTEVANLIGKQTLAQVSNWADFIKSDKKMRKYGPWHYVSFPKKVKIEKRKHNHKGDILTAITKLSKDLRSKKTSKNDKVFALKMLVHLIGDIHQPLHVGYSDDRGGNKVSVEWFGEKSNLHQVWDRNLIELQKLSFTEYAKELNHIEKKQINKWQDSKPVDWARESRSYLSSVYKFKSGKYWEYQYNYKHFDTLNKRLVQGGIRLAGHLNKIFK